MIETERLFIRPFNIDGTFESQKWFHDPDVMKWIPYGPDISLDQTKNRIQKYIEHYLVHGFSKFILIDKNSNGTLGDAGLMKLEGTEYIELGFRLKKEYWGIGLATEAAIGLLKYAFNNLNLEIIHAIVEPENQISKYIITQKLHFEFIKRESLFNEVFNLYCLTSDKFNESNF
jgi:RimJ/RimL family protein N-acetyltransferase